MTARGRPSANAPNKVVTFFLSIFYSLAGLFNASRYNVAHATDDDPPGYTGCANYTHLRDDGDEITNAPPADKHIANISLLDAGAFASADSQEYEEGSSRFRGTERCSGVRRRLATAHMCGLRRGGTIYAGFDDNHANVGERWEGHDHRGAAANISASMHSSTVGALAGAGCPPSC